MSKIIELQEVKELQDRFNSNAEELNQHLETLQQKIEDFTQINSFQGKAAADIKEYLSTVHGTIITGFTAIAEVLKSQFQKAVEEFNSEVDSDADAKIHGSYLDGVKKKVNGYSEGFSHSNEEAKKTVGKISDIVAIQYPSSSSITEGAVKSQKEISDTLEKLETYNSKQSDLQEFDELMRKIDEGMKQIKVNNGNLSSASIGKLLADTSIGNIIKGLADAMTKFDIGNKGAKATLNAYIRIHYVTRKLGFEVLFDPKGRKGRGAFKLSTPKKEDMVLVERILKMDNKDDVLAKYIKDKFEFKFEDLKTTKEQIKKAKKNIYKLPDFQAYHDFHNDRTNKGLPTAIGKRGLSSFKAAWADGLKDINPMKWKEAFKGLGKAGGILKGAGIFGAVVSVAGNVVDAKEGGWKLKDVVDVATDSAVDIGANAGAMAAGAVVGSLFLPPLGTVVGAGTAVVATWLLNKKWNGKDNAIDHVKKGVKNVTEKINEKLKIGEKLKSVFW
ncbi:T7SS effector LXG polymorphic toxin [Bacillus mycoides]|uniref:T7SS effector LXG polymorphic toxin n=1 Tax=Bacillus mycoides TaxID=1405 RepID=UPI003D1CE3B9